MNWYRAKEIKLIYCVTLSFAETEVGDVINMQNVLNHVLDRSSHLTGITQKFFFKFSASVIIKL